MKIESYTKTKKKNFLVFFSFSMFIDRKPPPDEDKMRSNEAIHTMQYTLQVPLMKLLIV